MKNLGAYLDMVCICSFFPRAGAAVHGRPEQRADEGALAAGKQHGLQTASYFSDSCPAGDTSCNQAECAKATVLYYVPPTVLLPASLPSPAACWPSCGSTGSLVSCIAAAEGSPGTSEC